MVMGEAYIHRILLRSTFFLRMVTVLGFMTTAVKNNHQFHDALLSDPKSEGINMHPFIQIVSNVSIWDFSFSKRKRFRFQHLLPVREAFHSWFVGVCWFYTSSHDEPVISVKSRSIFHDAQCPQSRSITGIEFQFIRFIWYIDQRMWNPGIVSSWRIDGSAQEKILSIINTICQLRSFFHEKIAKSDDLIGLGLILERERNRFFNLLASKASIPKASWKFASPSSLLTIYYVFKDLYFDVLSSDVLMYQLLYNI